MIVDLHLHSKYSYATSPDLDLEGLYRGAQVKGIDVLGTGDFTHPAWFQELEEKLVQVDGGLYQLNSLFAREVDEQIPQSCQRQVYFIPTVEVSCIYRRHDRLRKLHNVIVMPDLTSAQQLNRQLGKIGNLEADGRPTLGLDSAKLLQCCLEVSPQSLFIPAHIWTPWFGMFGSKSGFDSLEEAFGDWKDYIYAVETGLSSDPTMNWQLEGLDQVTLVSNSDAHSTSNLGREANVLDVSPDYMEIVEAFKTGDERFVGTIEFFPEEGKYHADGHRACKVWMMPHETDTYEGICPVCNKPLTIGVLNRVQSLATRKKSQVQSKKEVEYIVPLAALIAQVKGVKSSKTKTVQTMYQQVLATLGDEFSVLRTASPTRISQVGYPLLSRAIKLMRQGKLEIHPGYDGVYGQITVPPVSETQLPLL